MCPEPSGERYQPIDIAHLQVVSNYLKLRVKIYALHAKIQKLKLFV